MRLYVMRHGPAEDRAPSGRDFDRALTPIGRELVGKMARTLHAGRARGLARILTSPRVRARETASIVGDASATAVAIEVRDELDGEHAISIALVTELAEAGGDVLLVGHHPCVDELVRTLAHDVGESAFGAAVLAGFRTAMIVGLDAERAVATEPWQWRVAIVLDPQRVSRTGR